MDKHRNRLELGERVQLDEAGPVYEVIGRTSSTGGLYSYRLGVPGSFPGHRLTLAADGKDR